MASRKKKSRTVIRLEKDVEFKQSQINEMMNTLGRERREHAKKLEEAEAEMGYRPSMEAVADERARGLRGGAQSRDLVLPPKTVARDACSYFYGRGNTIVDADGVVMCSVTYRFRTSLA